VCDPMNPSNIAALVIGPALRSVVVQGSFAYVVDVISSDLKVIDVSDPMNPTLAGSILLGGFPRFVAVQGGFAYVVNSASDDLKVINVNDPMNPTLAGSIPIGDFPRSVAVQGGFAYVLGSGSNDLKRIDISDPTNPTLAGILDIGDSPQSVAVQGGFAYVVNSESNDVKVIDLGFGKPLGLDPQSGALLALESLSVTGTVTAARFMGEMMVLGTVTNPVSPIEHSSGATLTPGGVWSYASSQIRKENFSPIDAQDVLAKLEQLQITEWNYKVEDQSVRHLGPMAEDFHALFGLGNNDKSISGVDRSGVALLAIQELHRQNQELKARLERIEEKLRNFQP